MKNIGQINPPAGFTDQQNQVRFASRLSARAVTAGVFSTFAVFLFLMTFFAASGLGSFQWSSFQYFEAGIWVATLSSGIVSVYIGAYIAAVAAHSISRRDGVLNGFVTWAVTCSIGCALWYGIMAIVVDAAMLPLSSGALWALFIGDGIAIAAAVFGGASGALREAQIASEVSQPKLDVPEDTSEIHRAAS